MAETFRYDVFLSHSAKDKAVPRELAWRLRSDGLRVWFDEWEIKLRERVATKRQKIEQGLDGSRALVLCLSGNVTIAEWDTFERQSARFRDAAGGERRFISLRLDDVEIKDALKQFSCVDWRKRSAEQYATLLAACRPPVAAAEPTVNAKGKPQQGKVLKGHYSLVTGVAVTADGRRAVSSSAGHILRVWDVEQGNCLATLKGHTDVVLGVAVTGDGRRAVSGSDDKTVRVWDLKKGQCLATLEGHTDGVLGVAVTGDGRRAVSGSTDATVRVWDLKKRKCLATLEGHFDCVNGVAVTADGRRAVSGSDDGDVRVWDLEKRKCLATLEGHTSNVTGVAVTGDGRRRAVSCSASHILRVWDLEKGNCLATLKGHTGVVWGVAMTADGRRAVSGSGDNTVRVWDLEKGQCLATLEGHTDTVRGVAVTADGRRAVSCSDDRTVRVWELQPHDLVVTSAPLEVDQEALKSASVSDDVDLEEFNAGMHTLNTGQMLQVLNEFADKVGAGPLGLEDSAPERKS